MENQKEILKLQLQSMGTEMKRSLEGIKGQSELAEERTGKPEDRTMETTECEEQKERRLARGVAQTCNLSTLGGQGRPIT